MPLIPSASRSAMSTNISELVRAGHPQPQAIAAAYRNARQHGAKFAFGGSPDYFAHRAFSELSRVHPPGLIKSAVPGRTDKHGISVPSGSYVLPADFVSHLGQGNTLAGGNALSGMFGIHPPAMPHLHSNIPRPPHIGHFAKGGVVGKPVDIIVAGGEYILHPDQVRRVDEIVHRLPRGTGDVNRGHSALDQWVVAERKKHIKKLKSLPAPKK